MYFCLYKFHFMAKEVTQTPVTVYSILATGTKIIGDISSDSDLRLDGSIEGNILTEGKVILGPSAKIKGSITCANAEISGLVTGNINAPEQLSLKGTSKIEGTIRTSTLIIEPGAVLNGSCEMVK
jgi:cytoskeletal protein CcmA (bactofilin family)